jgi:Tfp pilus assembly protein PilE
MPYRMVYTGRIAAETDLDAVKQQLVRDIGSDPAAIDRLLRGGVRVVKQGMTEPTAQKLMALFTAAGAVCRVEPDPPAADSADQRAPGRRQPPPLPAQNGSARGETQPRHRRADERFCGGCGATIALNSLKCPYCGKRQQSDPGGCLTKGIGLAAIALLAVPILGILAAIAIPNYIAYRTRAHDEIVTTELRRLLAAEHNHRETTGSYTADLETLGFKPLDDQVIIRVVAADANCFTAAGRHAKTRHREVTADCNGIQPPGPPTLPGRTDTEK